MTHHPDHWQALTLSASIGRRPKRVMVDGEPIVLFRSADGLHALTDRCPHRLVELSTGRVIHGEIECPYHGWRFDGSGRCTAIPGHLGDVPNYRVAQKRVAERDGVVFIARGAPSALPEAHPFTDRKILLRLVESDTQSTLIDAAENILDATHTHFTHKGLLRGLSNRRQTVRIDVSGGPGMVEAVYTGEERQEGLVSRLLEGMRVKTIGRFRYPGIAELEYWGPDGLVLATIFHLRQATAERVEGVGCLIGPDRGVIDRLKALAFRPMFRLALAQDRRVLASAKRNAALAPDARPVIGPLDILRRDIAAILSGAMPEAATSPKTTYIEL